MFRIALCSLAVFLAATTAEAGKRQLLGKGSHGGYAPALLPAQPILAAPVQPIMEKRTVTLPDQVVKEWVQVERTIPGATVEVDVPLALTAPPCQCAPPMAQLLPAGPECRERDRRARVQARRSERRMARQSSSLGIEEPMQTADLPAEEPEPTLAE